MDALLFAKAAREEKDAMLENYLSSTDSMAGEQIAKLKAAGASDELIREVFDSVLTDCFYNILLGIDGQVLEFHFAVGTLPSRGRCELLEVRDGLYGLLLECVPF